MSIKLKTTPGRLAGDQLANVGLKATPQRLKVLKILDSHERRHLSAEEIYQRITEQEGGVGLATVYRVLGQLTDVGIVDRHIFDADSGKAVYELHQGAHHDHLICIECGRVEEFADDTIDERSRGVAEARGFALAQHELALYGYCSPCRTAAKSTPT